MMTNALNCRSLAADSEAGSLPPVYWKPAHLTSVA
jgi:hypothetical protein